MTEITHIIERVTPLGKTRPVFLLYGARSRDASGFTGPNLASWPTDTEVERYNLEDDWWPVVVELFEISPPKWPDNSDDVLTSALMDLIDQGAIISWYMFDGAFGDISALFDSWHARNTFGIASSKINPELALPEDYRRSEEWQKKLSRASQELYQQYPGLKDGASDIP